MKEEKTICDYIGSLELGKVQKYRNMAVVPLIRRGSKSELEYKVLHEAIDDGSFRIKEANAYGTVNNLTAFVESDEPILIIKGEYVVGGKQNRMITVNALIDQDAGKINIPVHCVEHHRWNYGKYDEEFKSPEIMSASLRGEISKCFSGSVGQSATWNAVACHLNRAGVSSGTQDFGKIYEDRRHDIREYAKAFDYVPGQVGFVAAIEDDDGRVHQFIDVFDKAQTLSKHGDRILNSYAVDALASRSNEINFKRADAEKFIENLKDSNMDVSDSLSLGKDVEISKTLGKTERKDRLHYSPVSKEMLKERITGSGLVYKSNVVYIGAKQGIEAFPKKWIGIPEMPPIRFPPRDPFIRPLGNNEGNDSWHWRR